jgi:16S rRNA (guanine(527)-N(7))-methyltransferase RsmG
VAGAAALGVDLAPATAGALISLLDRIELEPQNLTSITGITEGVERHLLDSLAGLVVPAVRSAGAILDLGSGAGFPGIPLAMARPEVAVTLVESERSKAGWLARASVSCPNVCVVAERSEDLARRARERWPVVTARAVAPLPVTLELAAPLVAVGGEVVVWRARPEAAEEAAAAVELPGRAERERVLARALGAVRDQYRYVFLDCPPSLDLLTVNALVAADRLIVPVQCEYYALEGLSRLMGIVTTVRERLNPRLRVSGMLMTMHDSRTRVSGEVIAEVRAHFPELTFRTVIPRNVRVAESPSHGEPIIRYDPHCAGADAYFDAAKEVALRG